MADLNLPGFDVHEMLHSGAWSLVARARRAADGRSVIVKCSRAARTPPDQVARLDREFQMGCQVDSSRVVRPLERLDLDGRAVLVTEDIGARDLAHTPPHGADLEARLARCLQLVEALVDLHAAGLVHRDINPSNVVAVDDRLQIIDLGLATALREAAPSTTLDGTLLYLAPEQTGRTHRLVDARADLYAVGCTCFEWLGGRPPFRHSDPLDLVHAHLAEEPPRLDAVAPDVPSVLADIVERLLQKAPEDRYQSASGLLADLRRAARGLTRGPVIAPFALGEDDTGGSLRVPNRLYGREDEVAQLAHAVRAVASGGVEVVTVSGRSGSGKTSLVRELRRPLALVRGVFVEGKFDPHRLGAPAAPLGAALESLVRSILADEESEVVRWRARIVDALGPNLGVVTELVPGLRALVGAPPPVPSLPPAEAENRLFTSFRALVRVLARPEHPLGLFLDDLQWADLTSLRLLEHLAGDRDVRHLLVVGAWRDDEVGPAHPLTATLARLRAHRPLHAVDVGPLDVDAVAALLGDLMRQPPEAVAALAEGLHHRTGGNAFFLRRLLESLHEVGVLRHEKGRWLCEPERVGEALAGADVASLLARRVADLADAARRTVQVASCVGPAFDLRTVASVLGVTPVEGQRRMAEAVALDLVRPVGLDWPLREGVDAPDEAYRYAFVHDRVQQAAYATLADGAAEVHLALGRSVGAAPGDDPFRSVRHLNRARGLLTETERRALARRNLDASRIARRSAAFGTAYELLEAGLGCLGPGCWDDDRDLALALHLEGAEMAYLSASVDRMEALLDRARSHTATVLEAVTALRIDVDARIARDDLLGALRVAHTALGHLGIEVPLEPSGDDVGAWVGRAMGAVGSVDLDELARRSDASDPQVLAGMDMLARMCAPAYYAAPLLLPVVACELVVRSVEHGLSDASPFAFAVYGIVMNSIGQYEGAHAVGRFALARIDAREAPPMEARVRHVVHNLVCVWLDPFQDHLEPLREVVRIGQESGDLEYAAIAAHCTVHNALYGGSPLGPLLEEAEGYMGFLRNNEQGPMLAVHEPITRCIAALAGRTPRPSRLDGDGFVESEAWERIRASDSRSAVFVFRLQQLTLRLFFGEVGEAWTLAEAARPFQDGVPSTYHLPTFHFYAAVAGLRVGGPETADGVAASLEALRGYAAASPANHAHKVAVLEALQVADEAGAEVAWRRAVTAAAASRFPHDAALAYELAALRLLRAGDPIRAMLGRAFLAEAHQRYAAWGAAAKVRQLEQAFPSVLVSSSALRTSLSGSAHLDIDAETVMRAASAISAELELDRLLPTLLRLSMQSAGARQGLLLLHQEGVWRLAAHARRGQPVRTDRALDDLGPGEAPLSVLRMVMRMPESMVVDDASASLFASDPGLDGARSLLVVPLERQGSLAAILYLAHDRIAGAFTESRVEVVRVLAAQAAVALENASMYDELEQRVRARTAELVVARRRAEVASQAKSEFLSNMSHELRTPLNAVLGYAQILMRQEGLAPAQSDGLQTIYDSGRHLLALINDVLDMARIEAGRLGLEPVPTELHALARGVVEVLELQARRKGLVLRCQVDPGVPRWVTADPRRLRQVLLNLLGNAVKFTASGRVELALAPGGPGEVAFEVADTGPGIPGDQLQRIFDPFEQAGDAAQRAEGAGLGLAITRQLVAAMGGEVVVDSVVGRGSTFRFRLPLEEATTPEAHPVPAVSGYDGPRRRVLVVDDGRLNRLVLLEMLEPLGFEVYLAIDGDEGLRAAREVCPDLVLMDLVMPGLDGFETTRALKAIDPALPVVAVSASVRPIDVEDPLFEAALTKPVAMEQLLEVVGGLLGLAWRHAAPMEPLVSPADALVAGTPATVDHERWAMLHDQALSGDLAGLGATARAMQDDPAEAALGRRIQALVEAFDDEGVLALLDEVRR